MDEQTRELLKAPGGLAYRLRQLREDAGLTGAELARRLGWDRTRVSKVEHANKLAAVPIIREWAAACGHPEQADELIALLPGRARFEQFRERLAGGFAAEQMDWDQWVRQAKTIFTLQLTAVYGLLQTYDYARAMMEPAARWYGADPDGIEAAIAARIERQSELTNPSHRFTIVMLESVLRVGVADPHVMWAQCDRIISLAALPNVTIGVIPLGVRLPLFPINSFIAADDVVRCDTHGGMLNVDGDKAQQFLNLTGPLLEESLTDWQPATPTRKAGAARKLVTSVMDWWAAMPQPTENG